MWRSDFMGIRVAPSTAPTVVFSFSMRWMRSDAAVWPALKRILRYRQTEIQAHDQLSLVPSTTLKPEPMPCDVKVIMIGDEDLYETLTSEDEAFKRLFKIKADFDTTIPCRSQNIAQYAGFICHICREEQLRPFDNHAVAAVVEFGVRLAGRQNKLSARLDVIADVLREADYWAAKVKATVNRAAVEQALCERVARVNMLEEKLQELITEGILLISTSDACGAGEWPVCARTRRGLRVWLSHAYYCRNLDGDAGVVNIEREVNLGDPTTTRAYSSSVAISVMPMPRRSL